jgi:hypothetical protein
VYVIVVVVVVVMNAMIAKTLCGHLVMAVFM